MKRALLHTAELYADGIIEIDNAMDTVNSYMGMTEHCNGYNLRRWIEDNIVFARGKSPEGEIIYEQTV